ncbi:MAG: hypothetical protein WCJ64_07915 [Rhodospirillaceae bacterium]
MDELDDLFLSDDKLQELIGIEFEELVLDEPDVKIIIAQDITSAFLKVLKQRPYMTKQKSQYDNKVHELYSKLKDKL